MLSAGKLADKRYITIPITPAKAINSIKYLGIAAITRAMEVNLA